MKIEIGKEYMVTARFKKCLVEKEYWSKPEKTICVEQLWRNGSFIIRPQNQDEVDYLTQSSAEDVDNFDELEIGVFEDWEFDSSYDGISTDLQFLGSHEWTEEEEEEITDGYFEEWSSYLEEDLGMDCDECEYYIYSGIDIEEFKGYGV